MPKPKNVDEYIARLEGNFAHPILKRVREIVHEAVPQLEEKIKWGSPSFEYKGLMISMVAFKNFAAVWFHKGALLDDPHRLLESSSDETKAMRKYHISTLDDLDDAGLKNLVVEAYRLNKEGKQVPGLGESKKKTLHSEMLDQALKENARARQNFEALSNAKKSEYAGHIESAKQQKTKQRRVQKALTLLEQGLGLNDQYRK